MEVGRWMRYAHPVGRSMNTQDVAIGAIERSCYETR
jgi:hypothetical protein